MGSSAQPLRLAVCIGSWHPREGGSERQLRQVLPILGERGVEALVITQALPGQKRSAEYDNVRVRRVGSAVLFRVAPRVGQLWFVVCVVAQGWVFRPTSVLSTQLGSASIAARVLSSLRRVPHVLRLTGGGAGAAEANEVTRRSSGRSGRFLMRSALGRRTTVTAPAQHLLDAFAAKPRLRVNLAKPVMNGVAAFPGQPDLGAPKDVLWYGRSGTSKNIAAFCDLVEAAPDISFAVLGAVDLPQTYDSVSLLGWHDRPESVIANYRAVVSTSLSEGMPNVALQALQAGVPFVAFDIPGHREAAQFAPHGVHLVPPGDVTALVRTLRDTESLGRDFSRTIPTLEEAADNWSQLLRGSAPMTRKRTLHDSLPGDNRHAILAMVAYHGIAKHLPTTTSTRRLRCVLLRQWVTSVDITANINRRARVGRQCTIGPHAGVGDDCILSGEVHLGPHVTMGPQCYFITGDHPVPGDGENFRDRSAVRKPIFVGEDAFIGARVIVLPGVRIGAGAAVAAGSVVVKDVPPGATVAGNPATVKRMRSVDPTVRSGTD